MTFNPILRVASQILLRHLSVQMPDSGETNSHVITVHRDLGATMTNR